MIDEQLEESSSHQRQSFYSCLGCNETEEEKIERRRKKKEEKELKKRNKEINKELKRSERAYQAKIKLLLLGTGESGKFLIMA